jgi:hypothetical protein
MPGWNMVVLCRVKERGQEMLATDDWNLEVDRTNTKVVWWWVV